MIYDKEIQYKSIPLQEQHYFRCVGNGLQLKNRVQMKKN